MSCQISELNGVKIYNFASNKSLPQFLEEAKKKNSSLRYNQDYRNRVEVIQGFDFPISCNQVQITPDQSHIIATGIYAPQMKIFDTQQLAEKCMRGLDSEVVKFCSLSDDYSKIALAQVDRNIEVHAQYGRHYKTRIPRFPRDITFQPFSSDLLIAASGNEIYRLSLDEGQFLSSFESLCDTGVNCIQYNKYLNVSASGAENGIFEVWDYRLRKRAMSKIMNNGNDITAIQSDSSGLQYAVGSSNGLVRLYDVRYENHILEVKHHYKSPINTVEFHEGTKNILSSSKKILKINSKLDGKIFTNIEPKSEINNFQLVPDSGMILMAQENPRIGVYFVPQLDKAPKWVPFLENLTEEMEEQQNQVVYDEFKFVSLEDLEKLEATNLIGTKMLKQHLHGYLMHIKLYQKLKYKLDPFSFNDFQKQQIEKQIEKQRQSRIKRAQEASKRAALVNQEYAEELYEKEEKNKGFKAASIIKDDRFGTKMFSDPNFQIDTNNKEYKLKHTSTTQKRRRNSDDLDQKEIQDNMYEKEQEVQKQQQLALKAKKKSILQKKVIQKQKNEIIEKKNLPFSEKIKNIQSDKKQERLEKNKNQIRSARR